NPKNAVAGVATFSNLTVHKVGTAYKLTASSGTLTPADSSLFNITHGAATQRSEERRVGKAYRAEDTLSEAVTVQDAYGNTVSTCSPATASIWLGHLGGVPTAALARTNPKNAVAGVATFSNLTVHKVGTAYKLTASSGTLTPADSSLFNITHGAATQLKFTTNPSATYTADDTITVAVRSEEPTSELQSRGPAATAPMSVTPSAGDRTSTLARTHPTNALALLPYTTLFRSHKVGTAYKLTASSGTLTPADSSLFNITHGAATQLKFTTNPSATYTADDTITVAV